MAERWIFTKDGQTAFYQAGDTIYTPNGKPSYYVSDGWWFTSPAGEPSYYINDGWVFTKDGNPAFYYSNS